MDTIIILIDFNFLKTLANLMTRKILKTLKKANWELTVLFASKVPELSSGVAISIIVKAIIAVSK
jgi:hypothetical protein